MKKSTIYIVIAGILISVAVAAFMSPYASSLPDGLEKVAGNLGFAHKETEGRAGKSAPAADYAMPGINDERKSTSAAGIIGVIVVFVVAWGVGAIAKKRRKSDGIENNDSRERPA